MHFTSKYGDQHAYLLIWMAVEIMPFGMTLTLLRGVDKSVQQRVAERWGIAHDVLFSWMHCLNTIRNFCAHHGRLWNRKLGIRPKIPRMRKHPEWHVPVHIENDRVFGVLSICKFGLDRVAPQSKWQFRLLTMLDQYPEISIRSMGFPVNWRQSAIWSNT